MRISVPGAEGQADLPAHAFMLKFEQVKRAVARSNKLLAGMGGQQGEILAYQERIAVALEAIVGKIDALLEAADRLESAGASLEDKTRRVEAAGAAVASAMERRP